MPVYAANFFVLLWPFFQKRFAFAVRIIYIGNIIIYIIHYNT